MVDGTIVNRFDHFSQESICPRSRLEYRELFTTEFWTDFMKSLDFEFKPHEIEIDPRSLLPYLSLNPLLISLPKTLI